MLEMLKKTYLAGADLAHKTWDEVEALSKELVKKAKMSENEGSKFLQDMKNSAARVTEIPLKRMRDRVFFIHFPLKWYRLIGILYIESILL